LIDFIVSSVYTKDVMPPKRARVSAECAIANIMQFMEQYDNNDSVTVTMVKSVMLKMFWIVYMGRQVSFSCISFHMVQKWV
jgi:Tfp pilus assembly protein PilE